MNKLTLPFTLLLLGIAGCSDNKSSTPAATPTPTPAPTHEFESSYWTQADYSLQKDVSIVFAGSMQEVLDRIALEGLDGADALQMQTETYDTQNRFTSTEILVLDPNAPEAPAIALLVEHAYKAGQNQLEQATMRIWDNWSPTGSGRLQQEVTWTDLDFEHDIPTISFELSTSYTYADGQQIGEQTTGTQSKQVYNEQHLLVERHFDRDEDVANGYEDYETWERDANGRLTNVVTRANVTRATYEFDELGRMAEFTDYLADGGIYRHDSYHYTTVEGTKTIVVEATFYPGEDREYSETKVMLLAEKACHSTTINRLRFDRPENANCFDANSWK